MSKQTLEYLKEIDETDAIHNAFIVSLLGIIGLYTVNLSNTIIIRNLKKYKQFLNKINDDGLDVFNLIQTIHDKKLINFDLGLDLMTYFRYFRDPAFSFDLHEEEFKELLRRIPSTVTRHLDSDVKMVLKAYLANVIPIERVVVKLFSYGSRKKMNLDFMILARQMRKK